MTTIDVSKSFKSETVKVAKDTDVAYTLENDVEGQVVYTESGNDVVATVYAQKANPEYEAWTYTKTQTTQKEIWTVKVGGKGEQQPSGNYKVTYTTQVATITAGKVESLTPGEEAVDYVSPAVYETLVEGVTKFYKYSSQVYDRTNGEWVEDTTKRTVVDGDAFAVASDVPDPTEYKYINGSDTGIPGIYGPGYATSNGEPAIIVDPTKTYGTITFKDAGSGADYGTTHLAVTCLGVPASSCANLLDPLEYGTYAAQKKGTSYTGNALNETGITTSSNETFNLGTGTDKIEFVKAVKDRVPFGNDVVEVNGTEDVTFDLTAITNLNQIEATKSGKDIKLSVYALATKGYIQDAVTVSDALYNKKYYRTSQEFSETATTKTYAKRVVTYEDAGAGKYTKTTTDYAWDYNYSMKKDNMTLENGTPIGKG